MKSEPPKQMVQSAALSELSRPGLTCSVAACSHAVKSLSLRSMTLGALAYVLVSCATVPETERLESAGANPITDTKSGVLSEQTAEAQEPVAVQLPSTLEQTKVFSFLLQGHRLGSIAMQSCQF